MTASQLAANPADVFEVIEPGLQTTVQDIGRTGLGAMGLGPGGAADPWALAVANVLVGNAADSAAIEITLLGPALRVLRAVTVGLAGADLGAVVEPGGRRIGPGTSARLAAGDVLRFGGADDGSGPNGTGDAHGGHATGLAGFRAYLAIAGGVDVPLVLGSRSTALGAGFGGLNGRALRTGDRLAGGASPNPTPAPRVWTTRTRAIPSALRSGLGEHPPAAILRIAAGPWAERARAGLASLADQAWTISLTSNRVGLRLDGDPLPGEFPADLPSHGLVTGAIQVPPAGQPLILLPDRQPTGGYAVISVVITADRPLLGQLAPGDRVAFTLTSRDEAAVALRQQHAEFEAALASLGRQP